MRSEEIPKVTHAPRTIAKVTSVPGMITKMTSVPGMIAKVTSAPGMIAKVVKSIISGAKKKTLITIQLYTHTPTTTMHHLRSSAPRWPVPAPVVCRCSGGCRGRCCWPVVVGCCPSWPAVGCCCPSFIIIIIE